MNSIFGHHSFVLAVWKYMQSIHQWFSRRTVSMLRSFWSWRLGQHWFYSFSN